MGQPIDDLNNLLHKNLYKLNWEGMTWDGKDKSILLIYYSKNGDTNIVCLDIEEYLKE
jgi:hypothetical protein